MSQFLIDTNICIYYLKGAERVKINIDQAGSDNCFVSEISVAELKFGVENSLHRAKNKLVLEHFLSGIRIIPIINALDIYAIEKARLRKKGIIVQDFDLLIGATAIANNLTLVTNNEKHFKHLRDIKIENWTN